MIESLIGAVVAIYVYSRWKHDYAAQKASEYAINLLKQLKLLHSHIEQLRAPKFFDKNKVVEQIRNIYIPKIDLIIDKALIIRSDLLVAKYILRIHKDMLNDFNTFIADEILKKINIAIFRFNTDLENGKNYDSTELWSIIFPSETTIDSEPIKKSCLGTAEEVVNDKFNKTIEDNFTKIYDFLEKEIVVLNNRAKKSDLRKFFYLLVGCFLLLI